MNTPPLRSRLMRAVLPAIAVFAFVNSSFLACATAAPGDIPAAPDRHPAFSAIKIIGDSLSDTGRTSAVLTQVLQTAFPPPPYATGRMSNGPLWIEYFAPKVRHVYQPIDNFSWAGATTGSTNVFGPGLPGMLQQVGELTGSPARPLDRKALYVVFGGANDFFRIFAGENPALVIAAGVTNLVNIVGALRQAGAENIVVVDLPDIGRTPRALAGGPASAQGASVLSATFNRLLNASLDALPFPVVRVSAFNLINDMVERPNKYGLTDVRTPGILNLANSDRHLFWDDVHPTTRAHAYVADAVFHQLARAGMLGQQTH